MTDLLFFVSQFDSIDHMYNFQIPKKDLFSRNCLIPTSSFTGDKVLSGDSWEE